MWKSLAAMAVFAAALIVPFASAQAPAAKKGPGGGVTPNPLLDRPEIRVIRTELLAGAVRAVHTHDDVKFHLFLPITPGVELTIGSDKPVMAEPGQAYFILKSTPHGFRNTTGTTAMVYEVFVKDGPAAAAGKHESFDLAEVLAMVARR
jgi:quercetin dioxygenase-like cupin family protein